MFKLNFDTCKTINYSYVIFFIKQFFPTLTILDLWHFNRVYYVDVFKTVGDNNIVLIDDELFEYMFNPTHQKVIFNIMEERVKPTNHIIVCKTKRMFKIFTDKNFKCVYEPFFDVFEIILSFKKLNLFPTLNYNLNTNYNFLNRNFNPLRETFIKELYNSKLMDGGYITANLDYNLDKNLCKKVKKDNFILNNYNKKHSESNLLGGDRANVKLNNIDICFLNFNILEISKNVPGAVMIQVESCHPHTPSLSIRSPSEKTFLPFMLGRIPIILGHENKIQQLKEEGFDIFEDIVNHEYDSINCEVKYYQKITCCIDKNRGLLESGVVLNQSLKNRLKQNYDYIFSSWIEKKLNNFLNKLGLVLSKQYFPQKDSLLKSDIRYF